MSTASKRVPIRGPNNERDDVTAEIDTSALSGDRDEVTLTRESDSEQAVFVVDDGSLARYRGRGSAPIWCEAVLDRMGLVIAARRGI